MSWRDTYFIFETFIDKLHFIKYNKAVLLGLLSYVMADANFVLNLNIYLPDQTVSYHKQCHITVSYHKQCHITKSVISQTVSYHKQCHITKSCTLLRAEIFVKLSLLRLYFDRVSFTEASVDWRLKIQFK